MKITIARLTPFIAVIAALAGCSGGGDSDTAQTAPLTLRVTDAPVDSSTIERVCVQFSGATIHYASQSEVVLPYAPLAAQVSPATHCVDAPWNGQGDPPAVRLDALGGALTVALADSLQVPVGQITWIRLHFIPGGSFIVHEVVGRQELRCPSCEVTDNNQRRGFKLNRTLEVEPSGIAVTVDVDLSKSLHMNGNEYVLRPTARLELDNTIGTIAGTVDGDIITASTRAPYVGASVETGCAVYVYSGADAVPDDHHDGSNVLTAARVRFDVTSNAYRFAAGALVDDVGGAKPYTVALTCSVDDPLVNQETAIGAPIFDEDSDTVVFAAPQNVGVNAGTTTTISFD